MMHDYKSPNVIDIGAWFSKVKLVAIMVLKGACLGGLLGALTCAFIFSWISWLRLSDPGETEWIFAGAVTGSLMGLVGGVIGGAALGLLTAILRQNRK